MKLAAGYYRMSKDDQELSIPEQRSAVKKWAAANGWKIVEEYLDEGISGDATEKRLAFQRMIKDAQAGRFAAILVWEIGRLGRFDAIEGGYWLFQLRQAGVQIISLDRGVLDWHDFGGRIIWSVEQEAKHGYLTSLSRDVSRGKLRGARDGKWMGGKPPLGYAAKNGQLVLVPRDAALVRRIFADYLRGLSLRGIAEQLNREGIPAARGGHWLAVSVRVILRNPMYLGKMVYNRINAGKYARTVRGDVQKKSTTGTDHNDSSEWIVIDGTHPALVDQETFDAAQDRLQNRQGLTTPHRNGGDFIFTGLLRCAKCGSRMCGYRTGRPGAKKVILWICEGYMKRGRSFCQRNSVRQDELLESVVTALRERYFSPRNVREFAAECRQAPEAGRKAAIAAVQKRLADADRDAAFLQARLCEVDPEFLSIVQAKLRQAQDEQTTARKELARVTKPAYVIELERTMRLAKYVAMFRDLEQAIRNFDPVKVRAFLAVVVAQILVRCEGKAAGKRTNWRFLGGELEETEALRADLYATPRRCDPPQYDGPIG